MWYPIGKYSSYQLGSPDKIESIWLILFSILGCRAGWLGTTLRVLVFAGICFGSSGTLAFKPLNTQSDTGFRPSETMNSILFITTRHTFVSQGKRKPSPAIHVTTQVIIHEDSDRKGNDIEMEPIKFAKTHHG